MKYENHFNKILNKSKDFILKYSCQYLNIVRKCSRQNILNHGLLRSITSSYVDVVWQILLKCPAQYLVKHTVTISNLKMLHLEYMTYEMSLHFASSIYITGMSLHEFPCILFKAGSELIPFNFSFISNKHSEQNLVTYLEEVAELWPCG
jgi:hypothetical protein